MHVKLDIGYQGSESINSSLHNQTGQNNDRIFGDRAKVGAERAVTHPFKGAGKPEDGTLALVTFQCSGRWLSIALFVNTQEIPIPDWPRTATHPTRVSQSQSIVTPCEFYRNTTRLIGEGTNRGVTEVSMLLL